MATTEQTKPTTSFWVISTLALLWNIFGVMSFFMQVFISPEALDALPKAERALYDSSPAWLNVAFAIAVFGGALGCMGLLMKKGLSIPLFVVSLIAAIIQMVYSLFMTKALEVYGAAASIMPLVVISVSAFLVWYSKNSKAKGWIS